MADDFDKIFNAIDNFENYLSQNKPKILIFGPGQDNKDEYARIGFNKRVEIRDYLTVENYEVSFPEEYYEASKKIGKSFTSILKFEKFLIENDEYCDIALFILIPNCEGLRDEIVTFSQYNGCLKKMCVFYAFDVNYNWSLNECLTKVSIESPAFPFKREEIEKCEVKSKFKEIIDYWSGSTGIFPSQRY